MKNPHQDNNLFFYVIWPFVEMRSEPCGEAEVVSQAYFSEQIFPFEQEGEWVKIVTRIDHYQGWVKKGSFCQRNVPFLHENSKNLAFVKRNAAHLYRDMDTIYGPMLTVPFESRLEILEPKDNVHSRWLHVALPDSRSAYIQRGDVLINPIFLEFQEICTLSLCFLGLPYTWGGRSSFGYDCSGFIQMLYRQAGIYLPRDSRQQFLCDQLVSIAPDRAKAGDLIFFGHNEQKICHVGMSLGKDKFIHACAVTENAPYIRISHLTDSAWNGSGYYPYIQARTLNLN